MWHFPNNSQCINPPQIYKYDSYTKTSVYIVKSYLTEPPKTTK